MGLMCNSMDNARGLYHEPKNKTAQEDSYLSLIDAVDMPNHLMVNSKQLNFKERYSSDVKGSPYRSSRADDCEQMRYKMLYNRLVERINRQLSDQKKSHPSMRSRACNSTDLSGIKSR